MHRHSHGETIACAVVPWDRVGVCEPPDPDVWPCTFPLVCDLPTTCPKPSACSDHASAVWHEVIDACTAFCAPPCTRGIACPSGTACVETVDGATCSEPGEACGGPERVRCLDIERCIHRASAGPEPRVCEVKKGRLYGSCEYPATPAAPCE